MDVPAADGRRRRSSPRCSTATPAASGSGPADHDGAGRPALPAGDDGARDDLGHADRLGHRARRPPDRARGTTSTTARTRTAARRPTMTPTTCCCARCAASTARSRSTWTATPCFDYGRAPRAAGSTPADGYHADDRDRRGLRPRADADVRPAARASRARASARARRCTTATSRSSPCRGPSTAAPETYDDAYRCLVRTADYWHEWLSHGDFPDHPWRTLPAAQRADAEGADLRADGSDDRGGDHVAARDPGRRAQLGLPLLLDPRLHVHAVGPLHARLRLGGQRLLLLHPGRRVGRGGPAGDVRRRRRAAPRRARARPPRGLRGRRSRCGSATAPSTRSSTTSGARCSTRSTCTRSRATSSPRTSGRCSSARSRRRSRPGTSPTAASGRCAASPSTSSPRRSSAGWPAIAARGSRGCATTTSTRSAGRQSPTRSAPRCSRRASTSAGCSCSTTTPTRSTRPACCCRCCASCRRTTRGSSPR